MHFFINKVKTTLAIVLFILLTMTTIVLFNIFSANDFNKKDKKEETKTEEKIDNTEEEEKEEIVEEKKEEEPKEEVKEEPKVEEKKEKKEPVEIPKPKVEEKTVEIQEPKTEEPPITYSCPSGYTQDGNKCHLTVDATLKCPEGTNEGGDPPGCINLKEGVEVEGETCPSGQSGLVMITIGGPNKYHCFPSYDKVYTCEDGYTLNGNKCTKTIDATKN